MSFSWDPLTVVCCSAVVRISWSLLYKQYSLGKTIWSFAASEDMRTRTCLYTQTCVDTNQIALQILTTMFVCEPSSNTAKLSNPLISYWFVTNWDLLQHDQDGWLTDIMINYVLTAQDDQQRLDSLMLEKWNQVCFWVESILANHEFIKSVTLLLQSFCIAHCASCLSCSGNLVGDLQESLSMLMTSPTKRRTTMIPSSLFLYWPSSLVLNLVIVLPWDWVHHNWSGGFSGPSIHPLVGLFCPFPSLHCMGYSPCTSSNTNSWLGNTNRHN